MLDLVSSMKKWGFLAVILVWYSFISESTTPDSVDLALMCCSVVGERGLCGDKFLPSETFPSLVIWSNFIGFVAEAKSVYCTLSLGLEKFLDKVLTRKSSLSSDIIDSNCANTLSITAVKLF